MIINPPKEEKLEDDPHFIARSAGGISINPEHPSLSFSSGREEVKIWNLG